MPFNIKDFRNSSFAHQTAWVDCPELKGFFSEDEKPAFFVRGLTANEIFTAKEALQKNSPARALAKAASEASQTELTAVFKRLLGADKDAIAAEMAYRIEVILNGVVDIEFNKYLDHEDVVKIAEFHPFIFLRVSDRINELTTLGSKLTGEK